MSTGYKDEVVAALHQFIAHPNFQKPFENFFLENALQFTDNEEQQLEYTAIYKEFQSMFDKHMAVFMKQQGMAEGDLMQHLKEAESDDPKAAHYLRIIVASMEYDAFVKLMRQMRGRSKALLAEAKSEAKGGETGASSKMSKGSKPSKAVPGAGAEAKGEPKPAAEAKAPAKAAGMDDTEFSK